MLFFADLTFRIVLGLILDQITHAIPDADQTFDSVLCCGRNLHGVHAAVFPVVHLTIHDGITEIAGIGIGRDGSVFFLSFWIVLLIYWNLCPDIVDGPGKHLTQVLAFKGQTGGFHSVRAADFLHLTHNHVRVVHKVLVHLQPVLCGVQMHPIGHDISHPVMLLEKENVRCDFRAGGTLEGVVGQSNGSNQLGPLGNVFPNSR